MSRGRLVLLVAALLGICASASARDFGTSLEAAKDFERFRLYYAGRSFEGESLANVSSFRDFGRKWWSFLYEETFEIQDWSICVRYPARYPGDLRPRRFRGAKALWNPFADAFEVYTGRTAVVIFAGPDPSPAKHIARNLRVVRSNEKPDTLPPPPKGSMRGNLRCQG